MATLYYKLSVSGPTSGQRPPNEYLYVGNAKTFTSKYDQHYDNTGDVYFTFQITSVAWSKPPDYDTAKYELDHNDQDHSPTRAWSSIYVSDPSTVSIPTELEFVGPALGLDVVGDYTNPSKTAFGFQNVTYSLSTSTVAGVSFGDFSLGMKDNLFTIAENAAKAAGLSNWATAIGNAGVVKGALDNIVGGGLNLLEVGLNNFDNPNFDVAAYNAAVDSYLRGAHDTATQALIDTTMFPGNPAAEAIADKILGGTRLIGIVMRDGSVPVSGSAQFGLEVNVGGATLSTSVTGTVNADLVLDGNGNSSISGREGNDWLSGGRGRDTLSGGSGSDYLNGGADNDVINGNAGNDVLLGGAGNDTYFVDSPADKVYETTTTTSTTNAGGTDSVNSSVSFSLASYQGVSYVENLTLTGTAAISGTGNSYANILTGNAAANVLRGANGNDVINGNAGNDVLLGGAGNDTYYVDNAGDKVYETTTTTSTTNAGGTDKVNSSVSFNLAAYRGVSFVDHLTLTGTAAINGTGNALSNTLVGNAVANVLRGASGNDVLVGGSGADTLYGDAGNDLLRGGAGNDVLYGGSGNDLLRFDTALSTSTVKNVDQIKDFNSAYDTIQLEDSIFKALGATKTGAINPAHFKANTTGLAQDSNDYLIYETDTGKLFYDFNGSAAGGSVQFALLQAHLALTSADYVLV